MKSSGSTTAASFVPTDEMIKRRKPFTDVEYIKDCFVKASKHLFSDMRNKVEIMEKVKVVPLSAQTVRDRTVKLTKDITNKQTRH